jgi:diadenosine tetraphosphate (Ap4A) HIT family hydrolase
MSASRRREIDTHYAQDNPEYLAQLEECKAADECPFCPKTIERLQKIKILYRDPKGGWGVFPCTWPYENSSVHLIIIGKKHKVDILNLTGRDWESIRRVIGWAKQNYCLPGLGLAVRSGDSLYTGAEIRHIHFHLITPKKSRRAKRSKVVQFPIG